MCIHQTAVGLVELASAPSLSADGLLVASSLMREHSMVPNAGSVSCFLFPLVEEWSWGSRMFEDAIARLSDDELQNRQRAAPERPRHLRAIPERGKRRRDSGHRDDRNPARHVPASGHRVPVDYLRADDRGDNPGPVEPHAATADWLAELPLLGGADLGALLVRQRDDAHLDSEVGNRRRHPASPAKVSGRLLIGEGEDLARPGREED